MLYYIYYKWLIVEYILNILYVRVRNLTMKGKGINKKNITCDFCKYYIDYYC